MNIKAFITSLIIGLSILQHNTAQQNSMLHRDVWNIADFGAKGDGKTLNTLAIQRAIDSCFQSGGGIVKVSSGIYLTGSIFLKSKVQLQVDAGAEIKGSPNREDYVAIRQKNGLNDMFFLIFSENTEQISITGNGIINGNGDLYWENEMLSDFVRKPKEWRPSGLIGFVNCRFLSMNDLFLTNSPCYTVWALGCENVRINCITIRNAINGPNTDGIDIDCCRHVLIADCNIEGGDDAIAIKSDSGRLGETRACENIVVSNCILSSPPACGIRIGYEGDSPIQNCILNNLNIHNSNHGINIISVLPNPGYPSAIFEGTKIRNIQFNNIVMHDVTQPIFIWMGNEKPGQPFAGDMRNVRISNLTATNVGNSFIGSTLGDKSIEDVTLSGIQILHTKDIQEGTYVNVWGSRHPYVIYAKNVNGLRIDELNIEFSETKMKWQHALFFEDTKDVKLINFSVANAHLLLNNALIAIENSSAEIFHCDSTNYKSFLAKDDKSHVVIR